MVASILLHVRSAGEPTATKRTQQARLPRSGLDFSCLSARDTGEESSTSPGWTNYCLRCQAELLGDSSRTDPFCRRGGGGGGKDHYGVPD